MKIHEFIIWKVEKPDRSHQETVNVHRNQRATFTLTRRSNKTTDSQFPRSLWTLANRLSSFLRLSNNSLSLKEITLWKIVASKVARLIPLERNRPILAGNHVRVILWSRRTREHGGARSGVGRSQSRPRRWREEKKKEMEKETKSRNKEEAGTRWRKRSRRIIYFAKYARQTQARASGACRIY